MCRESLLGYSVTQQSLFVFAFAKENCQKYAGNMHKSIAPYSTHTHMHAHTHTDTRTHAHIERLVKIVSTAIDAHALFIIKSKESHDSFS